MDTEIKQRLNELKIGNLEFLGQYMRYLNGQKSIFNKIIKQKNQT